MPFAFSIATKPGMTTPVIQPASAAFLPPATSFALIVRLTFLAPVFWVGLLFVFFALTHPASSTATMATQARTVPARR